MSIQGNADNESLEVPYDIEVVQDVLLSSCQRHYIDSSNDTKILFLMCIGLNSNNDCNQPIFSYENEPWSKMKKKSSRPNNNEFVSEILRRVKDFNITPIPRPNHWKRNQIMDWLTQNPITNLYDTDFLSSEVQRVKELLLEAEEEERQLAIASNVGGRQWRGNIPYIRLIMCLTDDNIKRLYLTRADPKTRQQIDARNSDDRYVYSCNYY
jgi:hypothetical protein